MDKQEATDTLPALGISYKVGLGDAKELVFQTHVSQTINMTALNDMIDKLRVAGDRQAAFSDLIQLNQAREQHLDAIENMDRTAGEVEKNAKALHQASGKRGEYKLTPAEVKHQQQAVDTRRKFVEMLQKIEKQIGEAKEKIGG